MTISLDVDNSIYMRTIRHWHPLSEKWAGADCLLTAIDNGWKVDPTVYCQEFWHAGSRLVTIYYFELTRDGETMEMPVITNPYARRLLRLLTTNLRPLEERDVIRRRQRENEPRD
jgi:hypothetical protein